MKQTRTSGLKELQAACPPPRRPCETGKTTREAILHPTAVLFNKQLLRPTRFVSCRCSPYLQIYFRIVEQRLLNKPAAFVSPVQITQFPGKLISPAEPLPPCVLPRTSSSSSTPPPGLHPLFAKSVRHPATRPSPAPYAVQPLAAAKQGLRSLPCCPARAAEEARLTPQGPRSLLRDLQYDSLFLVLATGASVAAHVRRLLIRMFETVADASFVAVLANLRVYIQYESYFYTILIDSG